MKVLLINGSPNEKGCTYTALGEIAKTLKACGVGSDIVYLGKKPISGCIACKHCYTMHKCALDDKVNEVGAVLDNYAAVILGSPVYYAGPSGQLTAFLDRLFYVYGSKLAGKPGAAIVSCRRGGASAAFDRLNKYFSITNMPIITSQYWNQVHGNTPEEVLRDEEGMQTMRTLATNTAWLIKCIEAGRKAGIERPEYEAKIRTNFIR